MDIPSHLHWPHSLPPNIRVSKPASTFAQHIHDLHAEICRKIAVSNDSYKLLANVHCRDTSFEVGDFLMACVWLEPLPKHFHKKLHARAMGPYQIIKKLGSNAYVLDLPEYLGISSIFDVEYLTLH